MSETRRCPDCDNTEFSIETFPDDSLCVFCADCGKRVLNADMEVMPQNSWLLTSSETGGKVDNNE